jgi:uncharacterized membrane protein
MFGYGGAGGGWPVWAVALMWIGMLAFWGVLIWIGYTLMTRQHQRRRGDRDARERGSGADARGVLDERLARGDINAAEYQKLRGLAQRAGDSGRYLPLEVPARGSRRYGSGRP